MSITPGTTLEVIRQTSLQVDKVTRSGSTCSVHVVVKNSPFQVVCKLVGKSPNFGGRLSFDIKLVYDMADEKEVAWVKVKPVEYKPSVNDNNDQITFDVKIKVLSSHHEDNFFKLRILVWDPDFPDHPVSASSLPIKVISKPLRKGKAKTANGTHASSLETLAEASTKRSYSDRQDNASDEESANPKLMHKMNALLEEQQGMRDELRLLRLTLSQHIPPGPNHGLLMSQSPSSQIPDLDFLNGGQPPELKKMKLEDDNGEEGNDGLGGSGGADNNADRDIEGSLSRLLQVYGSLGFEEKTEKLRRMLRNMTAREAETLVEFIDLLNAEGLQTEAQKAMYGGALSTPLGLPNLSGMMQMGMPSQVPLGLGGIANQHPHHHGAHNCGPECPHKAELSRIDQFYNEVFF